MKRTIGMVMETLHFHHGMMIAEMQENIWRHAFRLGAQHCREMQASFVEQGGDAVTAASLRANWNPEWGTDPGGPSADTE